jgi:isopentenyl-diphosphate delta-isomerase
LGNIGLSQATKADPKALKKLALNLGADAFAIHLNALQEALQPEGTPNFSGGVSALRKLCRTFGVPLILKETGCGFSEKTLKKIKTLKLAAVDVSGLGGTHWGRIEGMRSMAAGDQIRAQAAETFANWGVSTVDSVRAARKILPKTTEVWASGGVRSGLDAAKLLALGANRVGFAKPALEAALLGDAELDAWMTKIEFELRLALYSSGYRTVKALSRDALKNGDVSYVG